MTEIDSFGRPDVDSLTMALYGWDEELDAEAILPIAKEMFDSCGVEPNFGAVGLKDVDGIKDLTYKTIIKRIKSCDYKGLRTLAILHLYSRGYYSSEDFRVSLDTSYGNDFTMFLYVTNRLTPDYEPARRFVTNILSILTPKYGYSIEMPLRLAPGRCVPGYSSFVPGALAESDAWQAAWREKRYVAGLFRHVFSLNILSPQHMAAKVGDQTFSEWIQGPKRGTVEKLAEKVWLWTVPRENRVRCAQILHFNGLLTAPDPFQNTILA
jgi:hypothetical protein